MLILVKITKIQQIYSCDSISSIFFIIGPWDKSEQAINRAHQNSSLPFHHTNEDPRVFNREWFALIYFMFMFISSSVL